MYDTGTVTAADLRRLEALVTHKLDQLDAKWERRFAVLESSLGWRTAALESSLGRGTNDIKSDIQMLKSSHDWKADDIKSHIEMWIWLPWSAAVMTMIVVALLVTSR